MLTFGRKRNLYNIMIKRNNIYICIIEVQINSHDEKYIYI